MVGLAALYAGWKRYAEAESLYTEALEIQEAALHPTIPTWRWPSTAWGGYTANRGGMPRRNRRCDGPWDMGTGDGGGPSLRGRRAVGLADFHMAQGQYAEALPILERMIKIREKALGPGHGMTLSVRRSMLWLWNWQEEWKRLNRSVRI